jgi:hypothetical protein
LLPEDSAFCNKCGSRIAGGNNYQRRERDYEDWSDDDDNRGRQYNTKRSNSKVKYVVIGIGVAAFIALFAINKIFFSGNNEKNEAQPVSIVDNSAAAAADALQRALNDNNYVGDGATIVYALRITGSDPGVNDKIIGITQLNKGGDSFYKLYELTQNGERWNIDPEHVKVVSTAGRDVSFDQNKLKAGVDMIPQAPEIGGKKYFFYAFLSTPAGTTSNVASVVLNLYDIETRSITSATYEGSFQNVNGEQAIVCKPASGSSETVKWMNEQARNFIRILAIDGMVGNEEEKKPAEEVQPVEQPVEQPAQEAQPAEQAPATPSGIGEEKDKDTPMFKKDDIVETKQAGNYKVFRLKDGSVVRYDRSTGKNTKIHQGGAEAIGFEDTEKGILNIRKADGSREQVNLNTGQKTSKPAAAKPAETKPAESKTKPEGN